MSRRRKDSLQPAPSEPTPAAEEVEGEDIFVPGGWLLAMFFEMSLASRGGPVTPATLQTNEKPGGQDERL